MLHNNMPLGSVLRPPDVLLCLLSVAAGHTVLVRIVYNPYILYVSVILYRWDRLIRGSAWGQ